MPLKSFPSDRQHCSWQWGGDRGSSWLCFHDPDGTRATVHFQNKQTRHQCVHERRITYGSRDIFKSFRLCRRCCRRCWCRMCEGVRAELGSGVAEDEILCLPFTK
jgi:hypothetical protein